MKTSRLIIAISVLIVSLALVTGALAAASRGTSNQTPPPPPGGTLPEGGGPWVVRAYYDNPLMVAALAQRKEPWEVNEKEGYVVVDVNAEEYLWLQSQGFRLEVDESLTKSLTQPRVRLPGQTEGIPGFPCYRTVEETYASAEQLVSDYPDLAEWIDIGDSWEKVNTIPPDNPGYDLYVLRLTNKNIPGPKPKFFAMSAIHAREYATAELNTRFAEYLLQNYGKDPDVTWILDYNEVHLLLQTNPDGRKIAETGDLWRKNTDRDDGCGDPSSWGTDLNRNFNFEWGLHGGSSGYACDETYRGPSAASEPETQAVQNYVISQFPDQRPDDLTTPAPITSTGVFLDIHSYSPYVLWPWGWGVATPNDTQLTTLGRKFAYFNNYPPVGFIGYNVDGSTDDFAYGRLGLAGYVFEIGTAFFQDCGSFESTIYPDNLQALLYAAKVPRTPYMTPAGPDSLSVLAAPAAVAPGEWVELTAEMNGTRYYGSNPTQSIAAAEYYIDVPPWSITPAPISYTMYAVDGSFGESIEDVEAAVDTSGLSSGRHMIFVRGQAGDGNWGPVSAAFLYVVDPAVAPEMEGYVRDYATNAPLAATVTADPFVAASDGITGFYHMLVISGTYDVSAISDGYATSTVHGVHAVDYQTTQQNFNLLVPNCSLFFDDVESGQGGWAPESPWGITTASYHSPNHSWTDSPGSYYGNNVDISLTSQVFDLSDSAGVSVTFWHKYVTESGYDYAMVEYSNDGGSTWRLAASYSGSHNTWSQVTLALPELDGSENAQIRFHFTSDDYTVYDGWYIDDIELIGGDPSCVTPLAPTADFTSSSPVLPGETVRFTNMTMGSNPLSYAWNFGDGIGSSNESDPNYTYGSSGSYVVSIQASNDVGSNTFYGTVGVEPCTPISDLALTLLTTGEIESGTPVEFQADIGPDSASADYLIGIDFGDGSPPQYIPHSDDPISFSYTYTLSGDFTVQVSTQNCALTSPVTDTVDVIITATEGTTLVPDLYTQVGLPGATVTYTLYLTNTSLVSNSYNLAPSGNLWVTMITPTLIGPIPPGGAQILITTVSVPDNATGGASDVVTVTASSQQPGILPATASLTTSASERYAMAVSATEIALTGIPGSSVTYALNLTNTSNTTDTISIEASGVWTPTITVDPEAAYQGGAVTLAAGAGAVVYVSVALPAGTPFGESDTTLVSFVSAGDPLVGEEVGLTTTAGAYQVMLPLVLREQ